MELIMKKTKETRYQRLLRRSKVPKLDDGSNDIEQCWNWRGPTNNAGYGMMRGALGMATVHRISYIEHYKTIDYGSKKFVLHKCGNKLCVNPHHLTLGGVKERSELQKKYKAYNKNFGNPDYMWRTCNVCGNKDWLPHFKRKHSMCARIAKHKYITQSILGKK